MLQLQNIKNNKIATTFHKMLKKMIDCFNIIDVWFVAIRLECSPVVP